jgi:sterol 3beta-glucosyltransferase
MRVTIITAGSTGDVVPFLILGRALQKAGYTVTLSAPLNFAPSADQYSLNFHPIQADFQQLIQGEAGQNMIASGKNPLRAMREGQRVMRDVTWQMVNDVWEACAASDLIINHVGLSVVSCSVAEKRAIPFVNVALQPYLPTGDYPHPMWPLKVNLGSRYNRLTGQLVNRVTWQIFGGATNRLRTESLNLPPLSFKTYRRAMDGSMMLNAYSSNVVPHSADWPSNVHTTGYWFDTESEDWEPPPVVSEFLQSGKPPVYIGFGSMADRNPEQLAETALTALQKTGQRGVVVTGWSGISSGDMPEDVLRLDSVPHHWLFPQMSAVVHHGGAGTTGAGLRAGLPAVIVPHFADQPFWGQRVAALGVGTNPIPRKQLTADRLAQAIRQAVSDGNIRRRAAELGTKIRAENGLENAVNLIKSNN